MHDRDTTLAPLYVKVIDDRLYEYGLPAHATPGAAGGDLRAMRLGLDDKAKPLDTPAPLYPGQRLLIGTGVRVGLASPEYVGIVASRSGLSLKYGVRVAQGIGVIDSDYRCELGVILTNDSNDVYSIQPGERVAQLLVQPVQQWTPTVVTDLEAMMRMANAGGDRGGGFGSTGGA